MHLLTLFVSLPFHFQCVFSHTGCLAQCTPLSSQKKTMMKEPTTPASVRHDYLVRKCLREVHELL